MTSANDLHRPLIAVVGPGAVGGLVAALLQRARHDVVLVGRPGTARRVTEHGLEIVTDRFGAWHAPLRATTWVPRGARVLVAVKAEGVAEVAGTIAAGRPPEVVSLLNGIDHMESLRAALAGPGGPAAYESVVVGASYAGETLRTGSGPDTALTVRHRGELLRITVPAEAGDLEVVQALRDTEIEVVTAGSETEVLWSKLRFLAPLALLTSVHRTGVGAALDADPVLTDGVLGEVAAVAAAEGVTTTAEDLRTILRGFPPTMRSSLQADLAAGRTGELDAIGGAVARRGAARSVPTPTIERVVVQLARRVG
ncbi:ketopantoate reductase family protein [Isoptericola sp. S6320L]|uniref:ketopantoate reductase family protein n=1 Tax=Isoptericola sp. S6320L TaxID=2926411 RepID=UPI001FF5C1D0|nr:2-dehydropantoate 2-reductase N-terminal domain-containing protein [Isoptericola sp. S6320L]MCK0117715.1 ketopantoate reductase family protein [Isoptericola sp. S6320L]